MRYLPVHDCESLWWLLCYIVFHYLHPAALCAARHECSTSTSLELEATSAARTTDVSVGSDFYQVRSGLFSNTDEREMVMTEDGYFASRYANHIHSSISPVAELLEQLRVELVRCFEAVEEDLEAPLDFDMWSGFYGKYIEAVNQINETAKEVLKLDKDGNEDIKPNLSVKRETEDPTAQEDSSSNTERSAQDVLASDPSPKGSEGLVKVKIENVTGPSALREAANTPGNSTIKTLQNSAPPTGKVPASMLVQDLAVVEPSTTTTAAASSAPASHTDKQSTSILPAASDPDSVSQAGRDRKSVV